MKTKPLLFMGCFAAGVLIASPSFGKPTIEATGTSYSYWGGYQYSGYNNYYSSHTPTYRYDTSIVAAVQRRLGQLGYYDGMVDGVVGPETRDAIAAFESRNGLVADGRISQPLLDTLRLGWPARAIGFH